MNTNEMVKRFQAAIRLCMDEPEEFAKLLREEPDDKVVGQFIGLSVIYAAFGMAEFMGYADKADKCDTTQELAEFLEETKELRRNEDWRQAQREYIDLVCNLGDICLKYQEDTGE